MEPNINATATIASEQSAAKIISVKDLLCYLLQVKDGRKRRGIRYSLGHHISFDYSGKAVRPKQSVRDSRLGPAAQRKSAGSITIEA